MAPPLPLPLPPTGRTGWPWDAPPGTWPAAMPDGRPWPRLSIVTPSYNQGQFLEETIRSVLLQGYPNLEYMIVDGGSTDGSPQLIQRYAPWLTQWVSERDAGQADAINKGLAWATGDWLNWINSDDWFAPDALARLAPHLAGPPDAADVVYGTAYLTDPGGTVTAPYETGPFSIEGLVERNFIGQPATFFRRRLLDEYGPLSRSLTFALDYDLWLRWAVRGARFTHEPSLAAYYRLHGTSKSTTLLRTNQREVRQLLGALVRDGLLPAAAAALVPAVLRNQIEWNYARGDLPEFRRNVREFVRRDRRPPTARMARQYLMSLVGLGPLRLVRAAKRAVTGVDLAAVNPRGS